MTRVVAWPFYRKYQPVAGERIFEVSTVLSTSGLSPFVLGPCALYDGHTSRNMENAWQFSKVYPEHLRHDREPSDKWWAWARSGWNDEKAHRYPMGKGIIPEYSYWNGRHLSYVDARRVIYGPLYAEAVVKTDGYKRVWRAYSSIDCDTVILRDYDAYDHAALGMSLTDVLNDKHRKMGHAFVLAMLLTDDPALNLLEWRNAQ